ncbi:hypothetical protein D3C80_1958670 [compost metagenome]
MHQLMVDILTYLDSEYEKVNGIAENVSPETLENWIRSQVPTEDVDKVIREITNPFAGDEWRWLYRDLERIYLLRNRDIEA